MEQQHKRSLVKLGIIGGTIYVAVLLVGILLVRADVVALWVFSVFFIGIPVCIVVVIAMIYKLKDMKKEKIEEKSVQLHLNSANAVHWAKELLSKECNTDYENHLKVNLSSGKRHTPILFMTGYAPTKQKNYSILVNLQKPEAKHNIFDWRLDMDDAKEYADLLSDESRPMVVEKIRTHDPSSGTTREIEHSYPEKIEDKKTKED